MAIPVIIQKFNAGEISSMILSLLLTLVTLIGCKEQEQVLVVVARIKSMCQDVKNLSSQGTSPLNPNQTDPNQSP